MPTPPSTPPRSHLVRVEVAEQPSGNTAARGLDPDAPRGLRTLTETR